MRSQKTPKKETMGEYWRRQLPKNYSFHRDMRNANPGEDPTTFQIAVVIILVLLPIVFNIVKTFIQK